MPKLAILTPPNTDNSNMVFLSNAYFHLEEEI